MSSIKPLINNTYILEKYPGKGGWTFAAIPEVLQDKNAPFGWVKVSGSIDHFELKQVKLMPMGNGQLFLPVKAAIRKKIKKEAGDIVHVVLYADNSPIYIPEEFLLCLNEDYQATQKFNTLTEGQQKEYIDWIYTAKTDITKVKRMAEAIDKISNGLTFRNK